MENDLTYIEQYPLLKLFLEKYLYKVADYIFRERNLAFINIYYHEGFPAFLVRDDDGEKLGVVVEILINEKHLNANEYFVNGFANLNHEIYKVVIKLYDDSYISRLEGTKNKRFYVGRDINYWDILESEDNKKKLYISFPNFVPLAN